MTGGAGSRVHEIDPCCPDVAGRAIRAAVAALVEGALVVLPTETVYGIACRPDDASATARLFAAKRRPRGLSLPVLAATADAAWELGVPDDRGRRLAAALWPGPLTMVVPRSDRSKGWALGERGESIALRVPDLGRARNSEARCLNLWAIRCQAMQLTANEWSW